MRTAGAILALLVAGAAAPLEAQRWHTGAGVAVLAEAWDRNESFESLAGLYGGADRLVWRGLAVRAEGLVLRVSQTRQDAWLRGFTVGPRLRWGRAFADLAVGLSNATVAVPPRGTRFNYLAAGGVGVAYPVRGASLSVAGRWLHASNNGREGRDRNPDIQAVGLVIGVGWEH